MKLSILSLLLLFMVGCAGGSGDFRRISLSSDMTPGDLAHYQAQSEMPGGKIENYFGSWPIFLAPVFSRARHATADRVSESETHFHFEDTLYTILATAVHREVSNFDDNGRSLTYESRNILLFGLANLSHGHRQLTPATYAPTSSFSLVWGMFATGKNEHGRYWKFLWIPFSV